MKRLVIDVDSTLNDHWRRIRRWTRPSWPGGRIEPQAFAREEVLKDKPATYAYLVVEELAKRFAIRYLTARAWQGAHETTCEWLGRYRFPNPMSVVCVNTLQMKIGVLRESPPDYYVDDFWTGQEHAIGTFRKDIAERIAQLGIHIVVYRGCWPDVKEQIDIYEQQD